MITNLYKLELQIKSKPVHKYSIKTEPELPDTSKVLRKVTSGCRELLKEKLIVYKCWANVIYSL